MKHMTVLIGLAFLLSNVTSAITQDQKDFSPETTLHYFARKCAEQKILNFTPPRPPLGSTETWNQNIDVTGDGYCNWRVARPLRDAIRQYSDVSGRSGDCSRADAFDSTYQLHAQCTCYSHDPQCWVWRTTAAWGKE
jgi:hypothetical protein